MKKFSFGVLASVLFSTSSFALTVPMALTDKSNTPIGTIEITETAKGILFTPNLKNLPPGSHGFHIHENASCADSGNAAGEHLDPNKSGKHAGPHAEGHLGDLPILVVDQEGKATTPVTATRLKLADLSGRSIMIHAGGDNYSDNPEKAGGGGAKIACGVVKK